MLNNLSALEIDAFKLLSHRLFVIQPGETCFSLTIRFAFQHIADKLIAALESKVTHAAQVLFEVCNQNSITKALAGQLLDAICSS